MERQHWNPKKHLTNTKRPLRLRLPSVREDTHLEVFAKGFGAGGTLQLWAQAPQRLLWQGVTGSTLAEVVQQFVPAAKLLVTQVAGEQLNPHVAEGVAYGNGTVR